AQQRDREQCDQHDARGAKGAVLGQDRELQQRSEKQHACGLEAVHQPPVPVCGTSTITEWSAEKSTNGVTWIVLNVSTSLLLTLETVPMRRPRGNIDGSAPFPSDPAEMTTLPTATVAAF